MRKTVPTFCRVCAAYCGAKVEIEDGRLVKLIGDVDDPMYMGYSCIKGRSAPDQLYHPDRLLHPLRRNDRGFEQVGSREALDEVAARLTDIVDQHGPRSVALYHGNGAGFHPSSVPMAMGFMAAIGSPMVFSAASIDQPGKPMAKRLHGWWAAGANSFTESDSWIMVGANTLVSMWGGIPPFNPAKRLRDAKAKGLKLIVIDPRRTETAKNASVHLQPRPGEDPTVLAGLLRVIIGEGLYDAAFIADEVEGFEELRRAVDPFTPDYVSRRADVPADRLVEAARMFAGGRRGSVSAGTGPNMARRGTLTEYLCGCIMTICGRWRRAGEKVPNPFVLRRPKRFVAQAMPRKEFVGERLRVRGLGDYGAEGMPTAALADEILVPGEGQVRALIVLGGNPVVSWPDQLRTLQAFKTLDLSVAIDVKLTQTSRLCDYVFASRMFAETDGMTMYFDGLWSYGLATASFPEPYARWTGAIVDPPAGSDLVENWEVPFELARRMGREVIYDGIALDMTSVPTTDELHQIQTRGARIPLSEVKKYPHGHVFDGEPVIVEPKEEGWQHRLDVGNDRMMRELREVGEEPVLDHAGYRADDRFGFRLISRRMHEVWNSTCQDLPKIRNVRSSNPAFMNPEDMAACGFSAGDLVEIDSGHAQILGVVEPEVELRSGVISMAHGWGDSPDHDGEVRTIGATTGRLTRVDRDYDPVTGIPLMSAIPVNVRRAPGEGTHG